ncbi:MAG TPA: GerMN domain-containing protein [Arachnia sp.]|nr:GerMN domain-containing protein [Arachnia sp.]HMT86464.1 GerMN domain-containing protein [Arachnia sp.]
MEEESTQWLVELYEQQGRTPLFRLAMLLGAGDKALEIVHAAFFALHRRGHRVIDPAERIEFLQESVVHLSRAARAPEGAVVLPASDEAAHNKVLAVIEALPVHLSEHLIVSHYLARFGPELASIMRMTLPRSNRRLEMGLATVHQALEREGSLEATAEEVMAALRSSARRIPSPPTDDFETELAALPDRSRMRLSGSVAVALVLVALLLGFAAALGTRAFSPPAVETVPEPPAATASPGGHALPALVLGVPVYYVGRSDGLLYPELRDLPASGQLVRSALEAVFTLAPLDPDFRSAWSPGQVLDVELEGALLTVDLSTAAYDSLTGDDAMQAINQVVYTSTNLIGVADLRVRFLADGGPPPAPFDQPEGFATQGLGPVAPVRITVPKNLAQRTAGDVVVRGEVHPGFERPQVTVTDTVSGRIVAELPTERNADANSRGWDEWSVTVGLPPGDYDITVAATGDTSRPGRTYSENKRIQVH